LALSLVLGSILPDGSVYNPLVNERISVSSVGTAGGAYGNSGTGTIYNPGANDICLRNPKGCAEPMKSVDVCEASPALCIGRLKTQTEVDSLMKKRLTGTLPTEIGLSSDFDGYLDLRANSISGTIPTQLGNLWKLKGLFLQLNSFTGTIPTELGRLWSAEGIKLHSNQLSGSVPSEFGGMDRLFCTSACGWRSGLDLHWNKLTGEIPPEVKHFTHIDCALVSFRDFGSDTCPTPRTAFTNTTESNRNLYG